MSVRRGVFILLLVRKFIDVVNYGDGTWWNHEEYKSIKRNTNGHQYGHHEININ
jgi:hypothetical protein